METTNVCFGQLTKPLVTKEIKKGSTINDFCVENALKYGSAIRVNGKVVTADYILQENDIITSIEQVDGGKEEAISLRRYYHSYRLGRYWKK